MEIPWLVELESAHKSDSFIVVGVSMDTSYEGSRAPTKPGARSNPSSWIKLNYPVLRGDSTLITFYKLGAVPATYLIDKQPRIAAT